MKCERCGLINYMGPIGQIELIFHTVFFKNKEIKICSLCVMEIRAINISIYDKNIENLN